MVRQACPELAQGLTTNGPAPSFSFIVVSLSTYNAEFPLGRTGIQKVCIVDSVSSTEWYLYVGLPNPTVAGCVTVQSVSGIQTIVRALVNTSISSRSRRGDRDAQIRFRLRRRLER